MNSYLLDFDINEVDKMYPVDVSSIPLLDLTDIANDYPLSDTELNELVKVYTFDLTDI